MSKPLTEIPEAERKLLLELISTLREKESLAQLKSMHSKGYDTAELLALCMEGVKVVGLGFEKGEFYISAGGLIHLGDRLPNLRHAFTLLGAGLADLGHDVGHALDGGHDFLHRGAGLVHLAGAFLHAVHAGGDQALDLACGAG
jgi:hypothetical protein